VNTLRLEREGHVARLVLDRADRLNSFTIEMWRELGELGEELRRDPDLRALVVIGEGRAFSSGIDTSAFTDAVLTDGASTDGGVPDGLGAVADRPARHEDPAVDAIMKTQDSFTWLEEASFVTIAAVRGYALGAGLQLALACDLRVVARGTQLGLLELTYGIMPDLGGTQRLPRLVGASRAKDLIFTAARIDADEAHRIGLADRLVDDADLDAAAADLASTIAAQPPLAVRGAKRAVNTSASSSVRDGLRVEAEAQAECLRSDDMKEAIAAFVERRAPEYHGR
jgi:enoyl-CoA hydratase/carnithine racemase